MRGPTRAAFLAAALASCAMASKGPSSHPGPGGHAPCDGLEGLVPEATVSGSTLGGPAEATSRCGAGALGPEHAYTFALDRPARVRLELLTPEHDGALHLRQGCGTAAELACNEDAGGPRRSLIMSHLEPGAYVVYADGSGKKDAGPFTLGLEVLPDDDAGASNSACPAAIPIDATKGPVRIEADTFLASDTVDPGCSSSPGGPDLFYSFELQEEALVTAAVDSSDYSSPVLAVAPGCSGPFGSCAAGGLAAWADAGTQVLAVDSLGADLMGKVTISLRVQPRRLLEEICGQAGQLPHSTLIQDSTSGDDAFAPGCVEHTSGPEAVFRLVLEESSDVVLALNSQGLDGVLYIRSDCMDPGSEVACNDDHGSKDRSEVRATLEAGAYFVFVDGHGPEDAGPFALEATVHPTGESP